MAQRSYKRVSLARRIQGLSAKSAALIVGSVLCLGAGGVLLATTAESGVEIARAEEGATAEVEVEAGAGTGALDDAGAEGRASDAAETPDVEREAIKVHVDGAVAAPGVYELREDDPRVQDAVDAAGGLAEGADLTSVNLAAQVQDANKVHIPYEGEEVAPAPTAAPGVATEAPGGSAGSEGSGGLVNINSASVDELCALPGVGEATAKKIVADREASGPFAAPEDLMRVSGIGEKKFASLKDLICV